MKLVVAPYVGVAVPNFYSGISSEYWNSGKPSREIALFYGVKPTKICEAAGPARLRGVECDHCANDVLVRNRGDAISLILRAKKRGKKRKPIMCSDCSEIVRTERLRARKSNFTETKHIGKKAPTVSTKDQFYKSWEWRTLRMEVLKEHGRACQCCGAEPGMKTASGDPVRICVDHIKPLSKFWHLRLDRTNLQVLCDECNQGKGAWDQTDFRKPEAPDEWIIEDDGIDQAILHQLTDPTTGRLQ